jgi:hypothetical protein
MSRFELLRRRRELHRRIREAVAERRLDLAIAHEQEAPPEPDEPAPPAAA